MNLQTIKNWITGKRERTPLVSRQDAMKVYPLRNQDLEWYSDEENLAVITVKRRTDMAGRVLANLLDSPNEKKIRLDEVGTFVWNLCDGERTIEQIVTEMVSEHKLTRREVELSLTEFLRTLAKRGMIGVAVPQEIMDKMEPEALESLGVKDVQVVDGKRIIAPAGSSPQPEAKSDQKEQTDKETGDA
jgi:hypothetical protein